MILDDESQVKNGMTLFYIHILPANVGCQAWIECYDVVSDPYISNIQSPFVDAVRRDMTVNLPNNPVSTGASLKYSANTCDWTMDTGYKSQTVRRMSLRDGGINQLPRYNNHALANDLQSAMRHVEQFFNNPQTQAIIPLPPGVGKVSSQSVTKQTETPEQAYDRAMRGI